MDRWKRKRRVGGKWVGGKGRKRSGESGEEEKKEKGQR